MTRKLHKTSDYLPATTGCPRVNETRERSIKGKHRSVTKSIGILFAYGDVIVYSLKGMLVRIFVFSVAHIEKIRGTSGLLVNLNKTELVINRRDMQITTVNRAEDCTRLVGYITAIQI